MITLYDIASSPPLRAGSTAVWKARFCLNYKGLPYKTEWVEFPDIRPLYERLGLKPLPGPFGNPEEPFYSLPVIKDDSTGKIVAESFEIAKYLDETYPDTPKAFPNADQAGIEAQKGFVEKLPLHLFTYFPVFMKDSVDSGIFNPPSGEYLAKARVFMLKLFNPTWADLSSLDELCLSEEDRQVYWVRFEESFAALDAEFGGPGKVTWYLGDTISFADFALGGLLIGLGRVFGTESERWKKLCSWHGGKWGKFLENLRDYRGEH